MAKLILCEAYGVGFCAKPTKQDLTLFSPCNNNNHPSKIFQFRTLVKTLLANLLLYNVICCRPIFQIIRFTSLYRDICIKYRGYNYGEILVRKLICRKKTHNNTILNQYFIRIESINFYSTRKSLKRLINYQLICFLEV